MRPRNFALGAALVLVWALGAALLPPAGGSTPSDARASQLQDLTQLRRYVALDASYSSAQRTLASQAISQAESTAGHWTAADFELQVARVVALADNGHSTIWTDPRSNRVNRLPIRLVLLADGVFVARAKGAGVPALGMRIDSFDNIPTADILRKLRIYRGGLDNLRNQDNLSLLESPQLLHAAGIAQSEHEVTLTVSAQGHTTNLVLPALPPDPHEGGMHRLRYLAAQRTDHESAEWQSAFPKLSAPLWLQQPDRVFRLESLPALAAVYLQLKSNMDAEDGERIGAFLSQARRSIAAIRPQNVIVDMRFDAGGDYTKTESFMSDLPTMISPKGRVFVITHTTTFSAGISSVGFLKQSAPRKVTIVGEPIGDRLIFYGEPRSLTLPNSGIGMSYATGLHDYLHGCHWFGPCYWVNWLFPISVPTLAPELAAPLTFASIAAGRDPAMEAIASALRGLDIP
ncbi:MAG TPA: hypothetical protein VGI90_15965 [Steroidobacteraceae bacterium]|jgi:hypothetical protein